MHLVCWGQNRRWVRNEVKPNVYSETYLKICFTARLHPSLSCSGGGEHTCLLGFATLCANQQKHATAPEFQPPVCCLLHAMMLCWFMADSDKRVAKRACYRMELGKEGGDGNFLSRINKLIYIEWL